MNFPVECVKGWVIALALAHSPALIIADEPTTALDVSVQAQIIGLLKRPGAGSQTPPSCLSVTIWASSPKHADRVAVMYAGRVAEIGAVENVVRQPNHPYTQGLMASIPRIETHTDGSTRDALAPY